MTEYSERLSYIARPKPWKSPSFQAVEDFVSAALRVSKNDRAAVEIRHLNPRVGRLYSKLPVLRHSRDGRILVPLMGPRWDVLAAASIYSAIDVYVWDLWEPQVDEWVHQLERFAVRNVICSSTDAVRLLTERGFSGRCSYLGEAIDLAWYQQLPPRPLSNRTIDCLELGRKFSLWHDAALPDEVRGNEQNVSAKFEKTEGDRIFETREDLRAGLFNAKISVCFPRSLTHPASAGQVETFTMRYLESMACGCLVLGHAPPDLIQLFGYNPVVEVDWGNPQRQVTDILSDVSAWQGLVDRNSDRVAENGDWQKRLENSTAWRQAH